MSFEIKIGGVTIEIHHRYEYIKDLCKDYITDGKADFSVSVTDEQIQAEMAFMENQFTVPMCECTCLHREIVKGLLHYGQILIHSAVIAVDGTAYVFTARSGVGKSTHIRLWQEHFGENAVIVNGDKPMFSFDGDTLMVHGTPWRGKEQQGENITLPVGSICFIERGECNEVTKATSTDIINKLFHQVLIPDNAKDLDTFMNIIDKITNTIPFYNLKCNMEKEAAVICYNGIKREVKFG